MAKCPTHHCELENGVCPECEAQRRDWLSREKKRQLEELEARLGNIRLGDRYKDARFGDFVPSCDAAALVLRRCMGYASSFKDRLQGGDNMLMLGNYGTGKNMLAAAICNEIAFMGFTSVHTTMMKMLRRIKETWKKDSKEKEQDVIDSFCLPDLLVVDEVGLQFGTAAEKILAFEAINGRYENKKPTILISNLTDLGELQHYLGDRIMDRMREGASGILSFDWESFRGRKP